MGYSEFPNANYSAIDMSEFIHLYKDLRDKYAGTLDQINTVNNRLTAYENSMNEHVAEVVQDNVKTAMNEYRLELQSMKNSISELQNNLSSLESYVNSQDKHIEDILRKAIADEVDTINNTINNEVVKLNQRINELNTRIENAENYSQSKYLELITTIEVMNGRIDHINEKTYADMIVRDTAVLAQAKKYTDRSIRDVEDIVNQINVAIDKESIKWVWDNGCNYGGYDAWLWYMDVLPTAEDWHNMKFDCVDWYVRGREIFRWFDRRNGMFSPITGEFTSVKNVIIELCNLLRKGITAEEYENLKLSAEDYDADKITAFEYDWKGKEIFNV